MSDLKYTAFSAVLLREPLPPQKLIGVLIGFAGIAALTATSGDREIDGLGVAALLGSAAAWAAGSLYGRRATLPAEPLVSLNLQLLFGGLLAAPMLMAQPDVASHMFPTSRPGWLGLTYIVGMAIAAFLAFNWLNRNMSSTIANTFTYVAPVIALALSAVFLGEAITPTKAAAAAAALAGVALMMGPVGMDHTGTCKRPRPKRKSDGRP